MEPDLLEDTIKLARETALPDHTICASTGVSPRWLTKFRAGGFKDPGVRRVQRVNRFLSEQKQKSA